MKIDFKKANPDDAEVIAGLVMELTNEISNRMNAQHFDIDKDNTTQRCKKLLIENYYEAIIGLYDGSPIALATMSETYALYAGGKIGIIQEFYVSPNYRSSGVGAQLINEVKAHAIKEEWSCIELCTPPLPEFEGTINFYQTHGLTPVGGRKMRHNIIE